MKIKSDFLKKNKVDESMYINLNILKKANVTLQF